MENKYFTPHITDIRIGYECEKGILDYSSTGSTPLGWEPYIFKHAELREGDLREFSVNLNMPLRVPYLTPSQIENEGWNPEASISPKRFKKDIDEKSYYELTLNEDNQIVITKTYIEGWAWIWKPFYSGKCKDINTFRYICKLLGI